MPRSLADRCAAKFKSLKNLPIKKSLAEHLLSNVQIAIRAFKEILSDLNAGRHKKRKKHQKADSASVIAI